jgi:hypothetical protein
VRKGGTGEGWFIRNLSGDCRWNEFPFASQKEAEDFVVSHAEDTEIFFKD